MSTKYLAAVIVHNLLEKDYVEGRYDDIEKAIKSAITDVLFYRMKTDEERMVFSFPRDPSVVSDFMPVIVNVDFLATKVTTNHQINDLRWAVAEKIRRSVMSLFSGRRDVLVVIRTSLQNAAVAPA